MAANVDAITDLPPVYLISGELPGSGSTSLARLIGEKLVANCGQAQPEFISVGERLREELGVTSEPEMRVALANIPDPSIYDPKIYADLPTDRPVIVEGKLATRVGPQYIEDRELHLIDLTVHPFQSAIRVMQREGTPYESVFASGGEVFMNYFRDVSDRAVHVAELRATDYARQSETTENKSIVRHAFDTNEKSTVEIANQILGITESPQEEQERSMKHVADFAANLSSFSIKLNGLQQHPLDEYHFDHNLEGLLYQMRRFQTNQNTLANDSLKNEIKDNIIDSVFSLFMKSVPRFYESEVEGELKVEVDGTSQRWTPEFYKIAMAMPTLRAMIQDKTILDPYGGAGSLMFYLAAKQIPKNVICSDICYPGGKSLTDGGARTTYSPTPNQQSIMALFSSLPSWCRPDFGRIKGFVTADAMMLPFNDNSVDLVVGDPPYGINCAQGSEQVLALSLPELLRVSRDGVLSMVPDTWVDTLEKSPYKVTRLTGDLSMGSSNLPTCYILIQDKNKSKNSHTTKQLSFDVQS